MKLLKFLDFLKNASEKELVFQFGEEEIRKDYHITEVLSARVAAIDCGGEVNEWDETILQLLEPAREEGERFMSSSKALSILEKSFQKIGFNENSKLILEFRPENFAAAQRYNLSNVQVLENKIIVDSEASKTQCKAATRSNPKGRDKCCGPSASASAKAKVACCG